VLGAIAFKPRFSERHQKRRSFGFGTVPGGALNHSATLPLERFNQFSGTDIKDGLAPPSDWWRPIASRRSERRVNYFRSGSLTGTCGEALTTRGLPSA
jgi:hypothetical protein